MYGIPALFIARFLKATAGVYASLVAEIPAPQFML